MSGNDLNQNSALLFGYSGRIGRAKYWAGLAIALALAAGALGFGAMAMSPTGGSSVVLLGIPLVVLFGWIYSAVALKRLRDAGVSRWPRLLLTLSPFIWIAATAELINYLGTVITIVLIGLFAIPGLLPSKPASA